VNYGASLEAHPRTLALRNFADVIMMQAVMQFVARIGNRDWAVDFSSWLSKGVKSDDDPHYRNT
jgi:hypothetical protein